VPQNPGLQLFSKPFDSLKRGTWQGTEIRGIIRTLAVNGAPILVSSKDDRKTVAEMACDGMVLGAIRALCVFSLLVSQQNHSDQSVKALNYVLQRFYEKKGIFRELKMLKSAKAKVDERLATESYQLREQTIHTICAAMEALVFGAEKVPTGKRKAIVGVPELYAAICNYLVRS
jgi:hypothetical protein